MWKDFRAFLMRGNMIDLAVGVVIGTAFGKITTSLVNDIIMPPIGLVLGRVNFTNLFINLGPVHYPTLAKAQAAGAPTIDYGMFLNTVIDFFIIAVVVFFTLVKMNQVIAQRAAKSKPAAAPTTKDCPYCCSAIPVNAVRCPNCTSALDAS